MLHLLKLCVGCDSVADLRAWIAERARTRGSTPGEHIHTTRVMPKRCDELLAGGSLFWVIRGEIQCRQPVLALRPIVDAEGIGRCEIVLHPEVIEVEPRPMRPFQGWRYLTADAAPRDLTRRETGAAALPEPLRRELRSLGLW